MTSEELKNLIELSDIIKRRENFNEALEGYLKNYFTAKSGESVMTDEHVMNNERVMNDSICMIFHTLSTESNLLNYEDAIGFAKQVLSRSEDVLQQQKAVFNKR